MRNFRVHVQKYQAEVDEKLDRSRGNTDKITYVTNEFRFFMFRQWSLYDAMLHSRYVAIRLGIWRERGRLRLLNLLAKMGYSYLRKNELIRLASRELRRTNHIHRCIRR